MKVTTVIEYELKLFLGPLNFFKESIDTYIFLLYL